MSNPNNYGKLEIKENGEWVDCGYGPFREDLWAEYQQQMRDGTGFGHTSQWGEGPRNFAGFLAWRQKQSEKPKVDGKNTDWLALAADQLREHAKGGA